LLQQEVWLLRKKMRTNRSKNKLRPKLVIKSFKNLKTLRRFKVLSKKYLSTFLSRRIFHIRMTSSSSLKNFLKGISYLREKKNQLLIIFERKYKMEAIIFLQNSTPLARLSSRKKNLKQKTRLNMKYKSL
jgi:hypothetical protein